jgi:Fe-S-cluster containining protein
MSDPCAQCPTNCCGAVPTVRPVLMPWEPAAAYATEPDGPLTLLARDPDGHCVYFSPAQHAAGQGGCTIYDRRPLECCLYPLILDFSQPTPSLKLDPRAPCAHATWPAAWMARYRVAGH